MASAETIEETFSRLGVDAPQNLIHKLEAQLGLETDIPHASGSVAAAVPTPTALKTIEDWSKAFLHSVTNAYIDAVVNDTADCREQMMTLVKQLQAIRDSRRTEVLDPVDHEQHVSVDIAVSAATLEALRNFKTNVVGVAEAAKRQNALLGAVQTKHGEDIERRAATVRSECSAQTAQLERKFNEQISTAPLHKIPPFVRANDTAQLSDRALRFDTFLRGQLSGGGKDASSMASKDENIRRAVLVEELHRTDKRLNDLAHANMDDVVRRARRDDLIADRKRAVTELLAIVRKPPLTAAHPEHETVEGLRAQNAELLRHAILLETKQGSIDAVRDRASDLVRSEIGLASEALSNTTEETLRDSQRRHVADFTRTLEDSLQRIGQEMARIREHGVHDDVTPLLRHASVRADGPATLLLQQLQQSF